MDSVNHHAYKRGNTNPGKLAKHTDATRMIALSVYAETLNVAEASRVSGIPYTTIDGWLKQDETDAQLELLRNALRSELAFKCAQASALAVDTIIDRLRNGDVKLNTNNELVRVPVNAKDAGYLASTMIDRHALLTGTTQGAKANSALALVASKLMEAIKAAGQSVAGKAETSASGEQPLTNQG